ncbi:EAL domain-containing protein [Hydrogenobaculum acidophilum]
MSNNDSENKAKSIVKSININILNKDTVLEGFNKDINASIEIFYKIFYEFYSNLLQDYHAHEFFNSYYTVENLIKKQSATLLAIIKHIYENKISEATKELQIIARRHYELGINYEIILESIELYIQLLRRFKEEIGLDELTIFTLKDILDQTTATEYISGRLESIKAFFGNSDILTNYSHYDIFFREGVNKKINEILNIFQNTCQYRYTDNNGNTTYKSPITSASSHIECQVGQLLHGIGFDIMTFGNEHLKTETIAIHKLVHTYMNQLVKYYTSKEYKKALAITESLINGIYKLVYNYELISKHWNDNKEKLMPEILENKKHGNKLLLITIVPSEDITPHCELIIERLKRILSKHLKSFEFMFFTRFQKNVYVFLNENFYNFKEEFDSLFKDIELLAEDIRKNYIEMSNKSAFYIYKIDISKLIGLSAEEIKEILNILKEEAEQKTKEKTNTPVVMLDIGERKMELLEKARARIEIKNIVLEKVRNKDIDIFIQWICDINLNKRFFEILARVKKNDEYIPAYKFINILQKENAMSLLDIAVITNVIKNLDKIKALTNEFYLNIYPPSLSNNEVVGLLKELIKECHENNITLNLELTEYAIATNKDIIEELQSERFYIAFDDFGTGYTNYELVGELAYTNIAKTLKVDGYIVKRMLESNIYASIVESISIFSKKANLRVIYEFTDSEDIIKELKSVASSIGLPKEMVFFQGFYLHKPSPLEEEYKALASSQ